MIIRKKTKMANAEYYAPREPVLEATVRVMQIIDSQGARSPLVIVDNEQLGEYDWAVSMDKETGYVDGFANEQRVLEAGWMGLVCKAIGEWQRECPYPDDSKLKRVQDPYGNIYDI